MGCTGKDRSPHKHKGEDTQETHNKGILLEEILDTARTTDSHKGDSLLMRVRTSLNSILQEDRINGTNLLLLRELDQAATKVLAQRTLTVPELRSLKANLKCNRHKTLQTSIMDTLEWRVLLTKEEVVNNM